MTHSTSSGDAGLDAIAREYVRLVLAAGRHDEQLVDAYYGPREWKDEADTGPPVAAGALLETSRDLLQRATAAPDSPRRAYLRVQLRAIETGLRRIAGEVFPLDEEARLTYDLDPPTHTEAEFREARRRAKSVLPGDAPLPERMQAFRAEFTIPADRIEAVVDQVLAETRARTREQIELPDDETFQVFYLRDRPWSAYNWYEGKHASRIEVNLDLPLEVAATLHTLAHEGYPGHHTYNVLLETRLVEDRGWPEFQVHPLFSPQSLLAEGTANAGLSVILPPDEQWRFLERELAPVAGLAGRDWARYRELLEAVRPLRFVRGEAARLLLERQAPAEEVAAYVMEHAIQTRERADKAVSFIQTYRSYIFNYTAGEDLVQDYLGRKDEPAAPEEPGASRQQRAARFFDLLQRPATPSSLAAPS